MQTLIHHIVNNLIYWMAGGLVVGCGLRLRDRDKYAELAEQVSWLRKDVNSLFSKLATVVEEHEETLVDLTHTHCFRSDLPGAVVTEDGYQAALPCACGKAWLLRTKHGRQLVDETGRTTRC